MDRSRNEVRPVRLLTVCIIVLCAAAPPTRVGGGEPRQTDYQIELRQIDESFSKLQEDARGAPAEPIRDLKSIYNRYRRALLTGNLAELGGVGARIDEMVERLGPSDELLMLRAKIRLAFHQPSAAKDDLARVEGLAGNALFETMRADIESQEGQYQEARRRLELIARTRPTWDTLARVAFLRAKTGDVDGADRVYERAEEEITAKEMRSFAWVELQRGLLDFGRGRYDEAGAHYERAGRAYSGYWLVDEHVAELLGATGKFDRAASTYQELLMRNPRPEIEQALGDLYVFMGDPKRAKPMHQKALSAFRESARRGEVYYFHHLTAIYADVFEDGAEAEKWARKDAALRPNYATRESLAWALYRCGRFDDALQELERALAYGIVDPHLFYHAGMICLAAGRTDRGKEFLKKTTELNPRYHDFHVHR